MRISSFTSTSIAASVWVAATRNLTNPSGVWADAARSLTVDPATDAGAAALVWARATRTLTARGALSSVVNSASASIGTGTSVDLRPASGKTRYSSVGLHIGAALSASTGIFMFDGTNSYDVDPSTGVSGDSGFTGIGTSSIGIQLKNNSGVGGNYHHVAEDITQ